MKNLLSIVGLWCTIWGALFTPVAFAGTPDQDPVVKKLRQNFQDAKIPTIKQIQLGEVWECREYAATKDSFETSDWISLFQFSEADEVISNRMNIYPSYPEFVLTQEEFFGSNDGPLKGRWPIYIRVQSSGSLIYERTDRRKRSSEPEAISNREMSASFYGICPFSRLKTP